MTDLVTGADWLRISGLALAIPLLAVAAAFADRVLPRRAGSLLFWAAFIAGIAGAFRWDASDRSLVVVQLGCIATILAATIAAVVGTVRWRIVGRGDR